MFRVRVDNGLTQRNAEERGEGEGEKGGWVVIRGLVGRAKRWREEGARMASTRFASFVNDSRPINRHRQIVAADFD